MIGALMPDFRMTSKATVTATVQRADGTVETFVSHDVTVTQPENEER